MYYLRILQYSRFVNTIRSLVPRFVLTLTRKTRQGQDYRDDVQTECNLAVADGDQR